MILFTGMGGQSGNASDLSSVVHSPRPIITTFLFETSSLPFCIDADLLLINCSGCVHRIQ